MNEYTEIKAALAPILDRAGLEQSEEKLQPDVFGSAYSEYKGKGLLYRIIWDGRDGCGYIQHFKEKEWVKLKVSVPEGSHNAFAEAITRMRIVLIEHIALEKLNA